LRHDPINSCISPSHLQIIRDEILTKILTAEAVPRAVVITIKILGKCIVLENLLDAEEVDGRSLRMQRGPNGPSAQLIYPSQLNMSHKEDRWA
jgi:hypothetical protein